MTELAALLALTRFCTKLHGDTMTEFDELHAAREQLQSLSEIAKVISTRRRELEQRLGEIEAEHESICKLDGFMRITVEAQRHRVERLIASSCNKERAREGPGVGTPVLTGSSEPDA